MHEWIKLKKYLMDKILSRKFKTLFVTKSEIWTVDNHVTYNARDVCVERQLAVHGTTKDLFLPGHDNANPIHAQARGVVLQLAGY